MPFKLFDLKRNERCADGNNVYSVCESIILHVDGVLKREVSSITYSDHNAAHASSPMNFCYDESFDKLDSLIDLSKDPKAQKYKGMNSENSNTMKKADMNLWDKIRNFFGKKR